TAESIVEVEMAEGGVEIVAPEQTDHAAAEPYAFGMARRPVQRLLRFGKLVDLLRLFAGFLARSGSRRHRLVCRFGVVVLGKSGRRESAAHSPPARVNKRCNMGQLCWADSRTEKRGASWSPDWAAITASSRRGRNDNSPTALLCPAAYRGSALD